MQFVQLQHGGKNKLFNASVDGANTSDVLYSLIETAKANDMKPFAYLRNISDKVPRAQNVDDFEELLPLKDAFSV